MEDWLQRTKSLLGEEAVMHLQHTHIAVFGLGGVGSFAAEALARSGVGKLTLVDADTVSVSNINRQLYALQNTVGEYKTSVAARRIQQINPDCQVCEAPLFVEANNIPEVLNGDVSFCIDAIDTVSSKIALIAYCQQKEIPIVCCMGTGNKLHAEGLQIGKLSKTHTCPLCRVMRRELKNRNLKDISVVWSPEEPVHLAVDNANGRHAPASVSFVPPVAGFLLAEHAILQLTENRN